MNVRVGPMGLTVNGSEICRADKGQGRSTPRRALQRAASVPSSVRSAIAVAIVVFGGCGVAAASEPAFVGTVYCKSLARPAIILIDRPSVEGQRAMHLKDQSPIRRLRASLRGTISCRLTADAFRCLGLGIDLRLSRQGTRAARSGDAYRVSGVLLTEADDVSERVECVVSDS